MSSRQHLLVCLVFGGVLGAAALTSHAAAATASGMQVAAVDALGAVTANVKPPAVTKAPAFQPAPLPNPDIDPPHGSTRSEPMLTPALFSSSKVFDGDGYAPGSDPDSGLDKRRKPAAGLNWVVPVK